MRVHVKDAFSGLALSLLWLGVLAKALGGPGIPALLTPLTFLALGAYVLWQLDRIPGAVWIHLGLSVIAALLAVRFLPHPDAALVLALDRAALLAALLASLGLLRDAACTSGMVLTGGRMLVRQSPGRRYVAISGGSSLFGAILNFGVVGLLGGIVQQANNAERTNDESVRRLRERRMLLAILRGFSVLIFWCPLTVAYALVIAIVPGAEWTAMVGYGVVGALLTVTLGWALDRLAMPRPAAGRVWEPFDAWKLLPLVGIVALISGLAAGIELLSEGLLIHGVILAAPLVAMIWLALQAGVQLGVLRTVHYVGTAIPAYRTEVIVLGNAAFLGALISSLVTETAMQDWIVGAAVPGLAIVVGLPWLVVMLGQFGVNPLISVTVLAAVVGDPAAKGLDASAIGVALLIGWGLAIGSSPVVAATMMVGRLTGETARTVGAGWNGTFTLLALLAASLFLGALTLIR